MKRSSTIFMTVIAGAMMLISVSAMASDNASKYDKPKSDSQTFGSGLTPDEIKMCQQYMKLGDTMNLTPEQISKCSALKPDKAHTK